MTDGIFIQGWAAPYGGPAQGHDLHGERFSSRTDFMLSRQTDRPLLYHHGLDEGIGKQRIGTVVEHRSSDLGLWVRAQLDKRSRYYEVIRGLIAKGALSFSTGSLPELVKVFNGEILAWPWEETSLTPMPANPTALLAMVAPSQSQVGELQGIKDRLDLARRADLERMRRDVQRPEMERIRRRLELGPIRDRAALHS